jgi:4-alpha-glucanotransferase
MNYPLRKMLLDFFLGQIDAACLNRQLLSLRENYPAENFYAMMNLLGSHDVERLITVLGEAPLMNNLPAVRLAEYKLPEAKWQPDPVMES